MHIFVIKIKEASITYKTIFFLSFNVYLFILLVFQMYLNYNMKFLN